MATETAMLAQLGIERSSDKERRVPIDREQIDRCFAAYTNRPEIRACVGAIRNRILSRGVELSRSGLKLDADFQAHVRKEYGRFCDDAIVYGCVVGLVPYFLRKAPNGLHYPRAISPQECDLEMIIDAKGNRRYTVKHDLSTKARGPSRGAPAGPSFV